VKLYFARHGESEANLRHEFSNRGLKHGLTERGRQQMHALADKLSLASVTRIYSSPLLRAQQSAELLGLALSAPVEVSDALCEWHVGVLEGRSDDEAWRQYWRLRSDWLAGLRDNRIEGGESLTDIELRFVPFVRQLVGSANAEDVILLVAHGGLYAATLPALLGNISPSFAEAHGLDNAAFVLAQESGGQLSCLSWGELTASDIRSDAQSSAV
jgi:probable phosphoglycerate mutase